MRNNENIAIVILAAGESSRMLQTKQLLPWGNTTLLDHAIKEAMESNADHVYVVLGAKAEIIQMQLDSKDVTWILNKNWKSGMGSSIACAMNHLVHIKAGYNGTLVMLCDQPFIDADYLNTMITAFNRSGKGIVATAYKNSNGVPVLFHKRYLEDLSKLEGNIGAKKIILDNSKEIVTINPDGKEKDLDTFEDYQQAFKNT